MTPVGRVAGRRGDDRAWTRSTADASATTAGPRTNDHATPAVPGGTLPRTSRGLARAISSAQRIATVRSSPVVVPLQLVFAVNGALYGTLLPRYPQIADRVGATEGTFGLALLGAGVGGVLGSAAVTSVARRLGGPARAVASTAPLMVVAVAAAGAAPSVLLLFVAILVLGLADGICDPAMNAVGAAEQQRIGAVFMGRLHATWSAATLTATGIGALVAGLGVGVVPHVLVAAGLLLPAHVLAGRRVVQVGADLGTAAFVEEETGGAAPDPAASPGNASTSTPIATTDSSAAATGVPAASGEEAASGGATAGSGATAGRPALWAATIVVAMAAILIEIPPQEWAGLLLDRELGAGPGLAGTAPFAFLGGVLVARLGLDRLVDSFGWRTVGVVAASASLVGTCLGLGVGAVTSSPWPVLIGLAIAGAGAAPHFPLLFDRAELIARRLGVAPDAGAGIISTATRTAMLIGPLAVGQVADRAGLFAGLVIVPVVAGLMIPSLLVLLRPRNDPPST